MGVEYMYNVKFFALSTFLKNSYHMYARNNFFLMLYLKKKSQFMTKSNLKHINYVTTKLIEHTRLERAIITIKNKYKTICCH